MWRSVFRFVNRGAELNPELIAPKLQVRPSMTRPPVLRCRKASEFVVVVAAAASVAVQMLAARVSRVQGVKNETVLPAGDMTLAAALVRHVPAAVLATMLSVVSSVLVTLSC